MIIATDSRVVTTIRSLIFDFDGLILDTEFPELRSWQEIFRRHGCELSLEDWAHCVGRLPGTFDPHALLVERARVEVDRDRIIDEVRSRARSLISQERVRPGVVDWLDVAERRGIRRAVVSSSGHDWVEGNLERLGLHHRFELFICNEDVERHKPDPLPYREAVERLGSAPEQAIAVEDSPNGAAAARSAGLFTVVVPNRVTETLPFTRVNLRLRSLADEPLERLLRKIEGRTTDVAEASDSP